MNATNTLSAIFARPLANNPKVVRLLHHEDGSAITRIEGATTLYPVGSNVSADYDHPRGIMIYREDAVRFGIEIED